MFFPLFKELSEVQNVFEWLGTELAILALLYGLIFLFQKLLTDIPFRGRKISVPTSIIYVFVGIGLGNILVATGVINSGQIYLVIPTIIAGITAFLMYASSGSMNLAALRRMGWKVVLLGAVPIYLETFVIGGLITLFTGVNFMFSLLVAASFSCTSIGFAAIAAQKYVGEGYEKSTGLLQTLVASQTIDNVVTIPVVVISLVAYMVSGKGAEGAALPGTEIAGAIFLFTIICFVLAIIFALIFLYALKPIVGLFVKEQKVVEDGLEGEELSIAQEINKKQYAKHNRAIGIGAIMLSLFAGLLLGSEMAVILMLTFTISGFFITIFAGQKKSQVDVRNAIVGQAHYWYAVVAAPLLWSFGAFYVNLAIPFSIGAIGYDIDLAGFDASKYLDTFWATMPHILPVLVLVASSFILRAFGLAIIWPLLPYTWKQWVFSTMFLLNKGMSPMNMIPIFLATLLLDPNLPLGALNAAGDKTFNQDVQYQGYILMNVIISSGIIYFLISLLIQETITPYCAKRCLVKEGEFTRVQVDSLAKNNIEDKRQLKSFLKESNKYWNLQEKVLINKNIKELTDKKSLGPLSRKITILENEMKKQESSYSSKINKILMEINFVQTKLNSPKIKDNIKIKYEQKLENLNSKFKELNQEFKSLSVEKEKEMSVLVKEKASKEKEIVSITLSNEEQEIVNKTKAEKENLDKLIMSINNDEISKALANF